MTTPWAGSTKRDRTRFRCPALSPVIFGNARTMLRPLLLFLWSAGAAHAATLGLRVHQDEGPVTAESAEAVAWFAAALEGQHEPDVLRGARTDADLAVRAVAAGVPRVIDLEIRWTRQIIDVSSATQPDGVVAVEKLQVPSVAVIASASRVVDGRLVPEQTHEAVALASWALAPEEAGPAEGEGGEVQESRWLVWPEVALQRAMLEVMDSLRGPAWGERSPTRSLPVVLAVDAAWKVRHGGNWHAQAIRRVDIANRVLGSLGVEMEVVAVQDWGVPLSLSTLSARLAHLAATPRPVEGRVLRLGLSGVAVPARLGGATEVGRSFQPGADLVISAQEDPGGNPRWEAAHEAAALAHEVLHALGVPHEDGGERSVMRGHHDGLAMGLSARSEALAKAAYSARNEHWDPEVSLQVLTDAAERWLVGEPELQLVFIAGNLGAPPPPGRVDPRRLSPMANAALSRMHLDHAMAVPESAARHAAAAVAHAFAVREQSPALAAELAGDLLDVSDGMDPQGDATPPAHSEGSALR